MTVPNHGAMKQGGVLYVSNDLTLRDYFAAMVLANACGVDNEHCYQPKPLAEYAYEVAEAMLAERKK